MWIRLFLCIPLLFLTVLTAFLRTARDSIRLTADRTDLFSANCEWSSGFFLLHICFISQNLSLITAVYAVFCSVGRWFKCFSANFADVCEQAAPSLGFISSLFYHIIGIKSSIIASWFCTGQEQIFAAHFTKFWLRQKLYLTLSLYAYIIKMNLTRKEWKPCWISFFWWVVLRLILRSNLQKIHDLAFLILRFSGPNAKMIRLRKQIFLIASLGTGMQMSFAIGIKKAIWLQL